MLAPHERRLLIGIGLVLLAGAATDWVALHRPRTIVWLVGPERVAALRQAGGSTPSVAAAETAIARNRRRVKSPKPRTAAYDERGRLDLNAADSAEVVDLPGVGPALAGRILTERRRRGRFGSADDLLEVRGIGPKTLARLRPHVIVRVPKETSKDSVTASSTAAKDSATGGR